jgi:hypothetical protein
MSPRDPDERYLDAVRTSDRSTGPEDAETDKLQRLGEIARSLHDEDMHFDDPPPGVWEAIAVRAGIAGATGAARFQRKASEPQGRDTPDAPVAHLTRGRRFLAMAAVVVLLAAAAGAVIVVLDTSGDRATTVASVQLEPLTDVEPAEARLVERDRRLHLDLPLLEDDLPPIPGYYEVWLLDPNIEGMISLGPLRADGLYDLPANVDHRAYPTVDISREPDDGDPTHSGDSVLRGTLDTS